MKFSTLCVKNRIYLDHNATSPIATTVSDQVAEWVQAWGNPGSIHQSGRGPKALLRTAREQVADMIGAHPLEIVFTSGGSEANNFAIKGVFDSFHNSTFLKDEFRNQYLFTSVEHPSVVKTAEYLKSRGAEIAIIPVSRDGQIDLEHYRRLLSNKTAMVSVMLANNETGNIFPIQKMADIAHEFGALFHADCVQGLGKIPINIRKLDVDLASFSGHKFYALRGSGFLYMKRGVRIESFIHGGGQERHRRGGTENVLAIASLGAMCAFKNDVYENGQKMKALRDSMEDRICRELSGVSITGCGSLRVPNTSSLVIPGVDGETLLMNLDMRGYSVSTGAACSSGSPEPSPVLLGMGLSREEAQSSLRLGIGWSTSADELSKFIDVLKEVVDHLRTFSGELRENQIYNDQSDFGKKS